MAIADLNLDGFPDIVLANELNGTKTELNSLYLLGEQRRLFGQQQITADDSATAVAIADLNGDNFPDLVFASSGSSYQFSLAG